MIKGRKRKLDARRRGTTAERQNRPDFPADIMRHRLVAAGFKASSLVTDDGRCDVEHVKAIARSFRPEDPNFPLDVLARDQRLIDVVEDPELAGSRLDAGVRFTALYWRVYSSPVGAQDNGYRSPLNEEEVQEILERAKRLEQASDDPLTPEERDVLASLRCRALREELKRCGRDVQGVTLRTTAYCIMPASWEIGWLRTGLQALSDVDLPDVADVRRR